MLCVSFYLFSEVSFIVLSSWAARQENVSLMVSRDQSHQQANKIKLGKSMRFFHMCTLVTRVLKFSLTQVTVIWFDPQV